MRKTPGRLRNRRILLGVTGSVAALKAVDLARRLKDQEASVDVVMTEASMRFVTPLSLQVAADRVLSGLFEDPMAHIGLARDADLMLVAPATANTLGKMAAGIADDLLGTCYMACRAPVLVAPAMNWRMYAHPAVTHNLSLLKERGVAEIPPEEGPLACGEEGVGRMADVGRIVEEVTAALGPRDLAGMGVVVTAGPTREALDGVRFISNRSSGRMGYALARAARLRGAEVTLISGPTALEPPAGVRVVPVESAREMRKAVLKEIRGARVLIMAAAVADVTPLSPAEGKISKKNLGRSIAVEPTEDILAEVGRRRKRPFLVGFAAETGPRTARAREKLRAKSADVIVFNDVTEPGAGFETETNRITVLGPEGEDAYPLMSKDEAADRILDHVPR
jgi:phosphopantothenoylcysteine decarboxylase/phosphopantothenate--cysteine ligase